MAKPHTVQVLELASRTDIGTTGAQRVRLTGKVPGVVYGHGSSTAISVDARQLSDLLLSGAKSRIIDATIDGKKDSVLLRRVEAHPLSRKPISVDFQRVSQNEAVTASVHIVTAGVPIGVRDGGGVMDVVTHALDIKGPASSIPSELTIDVTDLGVHQHVTAGDVKLPPGFTLLTAPETTVIAVEVTRSGVAEGEDATAAVPAAEAAPAPAE